MSSISTRKTEGDPVTAHDTWKWGGLALVIFSLVALVVMMGVASVADPPVVGTFVGLGAVVATFLSGVRMVRRSSTIMRTETSRPVA